MFKEVPPGAFPRLHGAGFIDIWILIGDPPLVVEVTSLDSPMPESKGANGVNFFMELPCGVLLHQVVKIIPLRQGYGGQVECGLKDGVFRKGSMHWWRRMKVRKS